MSVLNPGARTVLADFDPDGPPIDSLYDGRNIWVLTANDRVQKMLPF